MGSPPPMRGKVTGLDSVLANFGITPAYAGKRLLFSRAELAAEDHPRLCGEKRAFSGLNCVELGSPPPMRGKVTVSSSSRVMMGITPAYAGKSAEIECLQGKLEDHPRLCGEKPCLCTINLSMIGSPPPMRGKASLKTMLKFCTEGSPPPMRGKGRHAVQAFYRSRITPAYAGKRPWAFFNAFIF